ncbi:nitrate/nitrite transporter NarK [Antricoccus suffuscus]|uniref:Nitrate/nitrite transporter NarK n=1 Tax=Antricoccus suffuscus TaxID=1629062 RepID=A0A2T0ZZ49_9ACTN|nr:MFS transporter [Antricoccus suffuscus]PRZ41554.1 nitrate/nitrite transporter NarK [Antricoccus suffuscus]
MSDQTISSAGEGPRVIGDVALDARDPKVVAPGRPKPADTPARGIQTLWDRRLHSYPSNGRRYIYLAITVLATVILYYELYIGGAVATQIIAGFGMTFTQFVMVSVIGNLLGAFASLVAGLADRWGRANLVAFGLVVTGVLIAFALPNAPNTAWYFIFFGILSIVEGIILVATPALIRDFSPQLGRASAMGFWTLGPVLGSLLVTEISSHTLVSHPDWQFQFYLCGGIGLVVAVIAIFALRELSPALRDQLMVSMQDKMLIEARAKNIDTEKAAQGHWRQMMHLDIVGSAFAIAIFLMFYYIAVGFFVIYFVTIFGYSSAKANGLANWYWISNAIALVAAGFISDKFRVRKPFMIIGCVVSLVGAAIFAEKAVEPNTSYYTFAVLMIFISAGGGLAYTAWMASFTETIEKHNPAATATGLAVWGWIVRIVVTLSLVGFIFAVPATAVLVDQDSKVSAIVAQYPDQVATAGAIAPDTLAALQKDPTDPAAGAAAVKQIIEAKLAKDPAEAVARLQKLGTDPIPAADAKYLADNGAKVTQAAKDTAQQWRVWWWICVGAQVLFLPFVFVMAGRWSPKKAREDEERHEALVKEEMKKLEAERAGQSVDA